MARRRRRHWVGPVPYGIGQTKPNHYAEMVRTAWDNRRHPVKAWRILRDGVCDGCALGTTGLRDFTMDGIHLCTVRLHLLKLNTMDTADPALFADAGALQRRSSRELRDMGRIGFPMLRTRGDRGFRRIGWNEALDLTGAALGTADPRRIAFYLTSRGITNETYYAAQKAARYLGTNNVDNASRLCHAASTIAMKNALGVPAATCSYKDWIGADLIVFAGSDVANNQPVAMKYLYLAKKQGTRVAVVNPLREPGLERYWVPSVAESALFGTRICDDFFGVHTGGDLAFFNGVLKHLFERELHDRRFVDDHTEGADQAAVAVASQEWSLLERCSGTSEAEMRRFGDLLVRGPNVVFVWSMGLTQHRHGVDTVRALLNVALARGAIGREHRGVMPIRGHSGVQGGAEMGCVPDLYPGARPVSEDMAAELSGLWGFEVPTTPGLTAAEMIEAAHDGNLDVLWSAGGNFLETLPEPDVVRRALELVPYRVHQDIVATSQMLVEPREWALVLPALTRYEQPGGGTETSTERQVIFSPEIPGPRPAQARAEWEIFVEAAARARPGQAARIRFSTAEEIRAEIDRVVPAYEGIARLRAKGEHFQWGGRILCRDGVFPTPNGRAAFKVTDPPEATLPPGRFLLSTRRGKQFNSMVQRDRDPLTGAMRDHVLVSRSDADDLGLRDDAPVLVRSETGQMRGRVKVSELKPRNVQVHWPEAQVLLRRGRLDPDCGVPDYNAVVELVPL